MSVAIGKPRLEVRGARGLEDKPESRCRYRGPGSVRQTRDWLVNSSSSSLLASIAHCGSASPSLLWERSPSAYGTLLLLDRSPSAYGTWLLLDCCRPRTERQSDRSGWVVLAGTYRCSVAVGWAIEACLCLCAYRYSCCRRAERLKWPSVVVACALIVRAALPKSRTIKVVKGSTFVR